MAESGAGSIPLSDGWDRNELSEMKHLLQQAGQRIRQLDPASKVSIRDEMDKLPKLNRGPIAQIAQPYITSVGGIARTDRRRFLNKKDRQVTAHRRENPVVVEEKIKKRKSTTGPSWFDMPRRDLSSESKIDFNVVKLRSVLDPHRHYRSSNTGASGPEFSQIGQIIEGPTEYYSSRLTNKERKSTFVEELLANEALTGRFKKKYREIQASKTSGKQAHYKQLKARRHKNTRKF